MLLESGYHRANIIATVVLEGEPHGRLRRLVSQAFTPRAVDALRPVMRAVAHELIDGFAARGACEFMAAFADPYPSRIIGALLGIPRERYLDFHGWATDLGLLFSYAVAEHRARIEAALLGLSACVDDLLAARRAAPGPDLISALIAAEEAGDQLSDTELRVLVTGLVFAGQDTTRNQLGCALATFLEGVVNLFGVISSGGNGRIRADQLQAGSALTQPAPCP
jgi:cytochrome P450